MNQNKQGTQTNESAQYRLEINFKAWTTFRVFLRTISTSPKYFKSNSKKLHKLVSQGLLQSILTGSTFLKSKIFLTASFRRFR